MAAIFAKSVSATNLKDNRSVTFAYGERLLDPSGVLNDTKMDLAADGTSAAPRALLNPTRSP